MAKPIVLTPIAERDLDSITEYLLNNWSTVVTETFLLRFKQVCTYISASPDIYPLIYKKQGIRKCILSKHNTIYFREHIHKIDILTIFDTRQDPDKLNIIIEGVPKG